MLKKRLNLKHVASIAACLAITTLFGVSAQNTQSAKSEILTVKEVCIEQDSRGLNPTILEIRWTDEKGNGGVFRYTTGKWLANKTFENVTNTRATRPKEVLTVPSIKSSGNIEILLSGKEKLLFEFEAGDEIYYVGVGTGSKFMVRKNTNDKYTLLLEETAKLSPQPSEN